LGFIPNLADRKPSTVAEPEEGELESLLRIPVGADHKGDAEIRINNTVIKALFDLCPNTFMFPRFLNVDI